MSSTKAISCGVRRSSSCSIVDVVLATVTGIAAVVSCSTGFI